MSNKPTNIIKRELAARNKIRAYLIEHLDLAEQVANKKQIQTIENTKYSSGIAAGFLQGIASSFREGPGGLSLF